jgi:heme exporter protein B
MTQSVHIDSQSIESQTTEAQSVEVQPIKMRTGGGLSAYMSKSLAVAGKDLRSEWRAKEIIGTMMAFSVLAVIIFGMAFDLRVPQADMVVPGVFWVIILFSGVMGLNRSFGAEVDRGSMAALLMAPVDRSTIYFGKMLASLVFMALTELIILPVILVMFDVNLMRVWILVGALLGTIGYVAVGTLFAGLTANTRSRETMLPVLLLPVMVPIFVAGVALTASVIDGHEFADFQHWLGILLGYDLIFMTVAYMVFGMIWEDAE